MTEATTTRDAATAAAPCGGKSMSNALFRATLRILQTRPIFSASQVELTATVAVHPTATATKERQRALLSVVGKDGGRWFSGRQSSLG